MSSYLLLVRDTTPESYDVLDANQRREALDRWNDWVAAMEHGGSLRSGHPLGSGGRLVSGPGGAKVVDGPYAEAKELVGGYFLLGDTSLEEVTEIARACPNLRHGMTVEIRPIADACHLAHSIGWETMRGPGGAAGSEEVQARDVAPG